MLKKMFLILGILSISFIHSAYAKLPYVPIQFPRDDAAHYANTPYSPNELTEWWYFNGNVITQEGRHLGYYIIYAYVQSKIAGIKLRYPIFMLQISDIDKQKVYASRSCLLPITHLGTETLDVAFGKNITLENNNGVYFIRANTLTKQGILLRLLLQLLPERPVLLANGTGYADGWNGSSMYYYSQPHLNTAGFIQIGSEKFTINSQKSLSWMNRQWTDSKMGANTQWQWANVQLENNLDLDLWQIVDPVSHKIIARGANIMMPDGSTLFTNKLTYTPHPIPSGQHYPQIYDLSIPEINLDLTFTASVPNQDANGFWEGINAITGLYQDASIKGHGYTENTERGTGKTVMPARF